LLQKEFKVICHKGVSLFTIRHFNSEAIESLQKGKAILLEQRAKETLQLVVQ
jgi:aspartate kinase